MDFCRNVSVPGEYHQQEQVLSPPCSKLGALTTIDDLFPPQDTQVDVSLEWLSIFVEDCFSSTGNCLPAAAVPSTDVENASTTPPKPSSKLLQKNKPQHTPPSLQKFVVPGKARSKRKRATSTKTETLTYPLTGWTNHINTHKQLLHFTSSDPPLLQQAYWLADSELILPKKQDTNNICSKNNKAKENNVPEQDEEVEELEKGKEGSLGNFEGSSGQQPRRCTHCLAQRTPQWRAGPLGPKTLCNACGVRYKSGRLLPEYRPAKSPTFVSYLHSNSHKKVMEMRMALLPSVPK